MAPLRSDSHGVNFNNFSFEFYVNSLANLKPQEQQERTFFERNALKDLQMLAQ